MALSIETISDQAIRFGVTDYALTVDVSGSPDTVEVLGLMEGFSYSWDAADGEVTIKSTDVSRILIGADWTIEAKKGSDTLTERIRYNVIYPLVLFETLDTIHLYRAVPINVDIAMLHIPQSFLSSCPLVGLKSVNTETGLKFEGEIDADDVFASNTGDFTITVPSLIDLTEDEYDYPYQIETGTPPALGTISYTANGDFGEIEFDEVTNAFAYDWTLGTDHDAQWNLFSSTKPVIDPREIEVTPGSLEVTITFPHITNVAEYEYQLESESGASAWTRFEGTLSNGLISTIIPNLEEGVRYTLRVRVGSPWIGTPTSKIIYGGRLAYIIAETSSNPYIYIFHTGYADFATPQRVKRLQLPSPLTFADVRGLAVKSNGDVFILHYTDTDKDIYTFHASTIEAAADDSTLTADLINPFPSDLSNLGLFNNPKYYGMVVDDDYLYPYLNGIDDARVNSGVTQVPIPTVTGTTLSLTNLSPDRVTFSPAISSGLSMTDEFFWVTSRRRYSRSDNSTTDYSLRTRDNGDNVTALGLHVFNINFSNILYAVTEDYFGRHEPGQPDGSTLHFPVTHQLNYPAGVGAKKKYLAML